MQQDLEQLISNHPTVLVFLFSEEDEKVFEQSGMKDVLGKHFKLEYVFSDVIASSRHCEERFLRRSNPGLDVKVKTWIASSQKALLAMTKPQSLLYRAANKIKKKKLEWKTTKGQFGLLTSKGVASPLPTSLDQTSRKWRCDPLFAIVPAWKKIDTHDEVITACANSHIPCIVLHEKPNGQDYLDRFIKYCEQIETHARYERSIRNGCKKITISHTYGAHKLAKEYTQTTTDQPVIPGYWMHGWIPEYHNIDPLLIALHKNDRQHDGYDYQSQIEEDKKNIPQWVAREDQAVYLRSHGYQQVKAIGLPIVYLPPISVKRIPGSLLVLPPHGHENHGPDDPLANEYARMIADLKTQFKHIYVGLYHKDYSHKQWVESFNRYGLRVFKTADQTDANTLLRLATLLSSFEYVTTNGFGSQIALAAYFGAKISIYGPFANYPKEGLKITHAVKMVPELLEPAYSLCTEDQFKKHYSFLFNEPHKATTHQEWGAHEVGVQCRISPNEMATLFGWETFTRVASDPHPNPLPQPP